MTTSRSAPDLTSSKSSHSPATPYLPPLPGHIFPLVAEIRRLRERVLSYSKDQELPLCILHGPSGSGKSTLALQLCHDDDIILKFNHRIIWLDIGPHPYDLLDQINEIGEVFSDTWLYKSTARSALEQLYNTLSSEDTLIVMDHVSSIQQAVQYRPPFKNIYTLYTTRNARIASALDVREVEVSSFISSIRTQIVSSHQLPFSRESEIALIDYLDPLALHLSCVCVQRNVSLSFLNSINTKKNGYPLHALFDALIQSLSDTLRTLTHSLVVFPANTPLSYPVISAFWRSQNDALSEEEINLLFDTLTSFEILSHRSQSNMGALSDAFRNYAQEHPDIDSNAFQALFIERYPLSDLLDSQKHVDDYVYRFYCYHLHQANRTGDLFQLLVSVEWILTKLRLTTSEALLEDYQFAVAEKTLRIIEEAIRLSRHTLEPDRRQVIVQLIGRLQHLNIPAIDQLVDSLRTHRAAEPVWLDPSHVHLTTPSSALIRKYEGHMADIQSIEIDTSTLTAVSASTDRSIRIWNIRDGQSKGVLRGHERGVNRAVFTPNGKHIISAAEDMTLKLWDVQTNSLLRSHSVLSSPAVTLKPLSDNHSVLYSDDSGYAFLCDLWSGDVKRMFRASHTQIWSFALTPEETLGFTAGNNASIDVWDIQTGHQKRTLEAHDDWIWDLAITANGRYLLSSSEDHTVMIWDLFGANVIRVLKGHRAGVRLVILAQNDGLIISVDADQCIIVWEFNTGTLLRTFTGLTNWMHDLEVLPDGDGVLIASDEPTLKLWSLMGNMYHSEQESHEKGVRALALSPDDLYLVSASDDASLMKWHVESGTLSQSFEGHSDWISDLHISRNGKLAISSSFDKTLAIWDLENGQRHHTLHGHSDWVWCTAISWDGSYMVSGSEDRTLILWNLQTGRPLRTLEGHQGGVTDVLISDDNKHIISASLDRTIRIWSTVDGSLKHELKGHTERITQIILSPLDQRVISASEDGTIRLWSFQFGHEVDRIESGSAVGHIHAVQKGLRLASTTKDMGLRIWDFLEERQIHTMHGHTKEISYLVVSSDSNWAATTGYDCALCLWDLEKGQLLDRYYADYPMTFCAFSKDNQRLIGADGGGGLHFLNIRGTELIY